MRSWCDDVARVKFGIIITGRMFLKIRSRRHLLRIKIERITENFNLKRFVCLSFPCKAPKDAPLLLRHRFPAPGPFSVKIYISIFWLKRILRCGNFLRLFEFGVLRLVKSKVYRDFKQETDELWWIFCFRAPLPLRLLSVASLGSWWNPRILSR